MARRAAGAGAAAPEENDPFALLRNSFAFAYVAEFLHHFWPVIFRAQDDPQPTTSFLEYMLIYQDDAKKICTVYLKILKCLSSYRFASIDNFFEGLAKEFTRRKLPVNFPNPAPPSAILTVSLLERVQLLRQVCDFLLEDVDAFTDLLAGSGVKDLGNEWRLVPVGEDAQSRRYWLLSNGRLYRERRPFVAAKKKSKSSSWDSQAIDEDEWELLCISKSDYEELFAGTIGELTNRPRDRSLIKDIKNIFHDSLDAVLAFELSQHKKYLVQPARDLLPRKRSSRLLEREIEDAQRKQEDDAARRERDLLLYEQQQLRLASLEQVAEEDRDAAAKERERRAEQRQLKRERELQVKAIEDAYFASHDQQNVDIEHEEAVPEAVSESAQSPIRIIIKLPATSKPVDLIIPEARDNHITEPRQQPFSVDELSPHDAIVVSSETHESVAKTPESRSDNDAALLTDFSSSFLLPSSSPNRPVTDQ